MSTLADLPELVGFFSYSRRDDEHSQGALSRLRSRIHSELRLQLGRDFRLWQDTAAIPEGALWEDEIRRAISESVFFVPIVTPSAVGSGHCRFEFGSFLRREAEFGRSDLIFPILYVTVDALESEEQWRRDEVLKIIGTRQYLDWRALRFHDFSSTEIGQKVEQFCRNIARALRKSWVTPEERRAQEAADARRHANDERLRAAEVERPAREGEARQRAEAVARSKREAEEREEKTRRRQEAEARARAAEQERVRREEAQASKRAAEESQGQPGADVSAAHSQSAGSTTPASPGGRSETSTAALVFKPWKPVETRQQAQALAKVGTAGLAALSLLFLVIGLAGLVVTNADPPAPNFIMAFLYGLTALGTWFQWRSAAVAGLVLSLPFFILVIPVCTSLAGVRAAFAANRFLRAKPDPVG